MRSIGDTVLATPSLTALRKALPDAEIDILLEDAVAPILEGAEDIRVIRVGTSGIARVAAGRRLAAAKYDAVINLHGGTTASTLTAASRAKVRIGFSHYRYPRVYTHLYPSADEFWGTSELHSVEQQLALLGLAGISVDRDTPTWLPADKNAEALIDEKLGSIGPIALLHPAAALESKTWPVTNFAIVADDLATRGFEVVAVAAPSEAKVLADLSEAAHSSLRTFSHLTLPEITALARRASLFIGNDSGIAHIAAAVETPAIVIFGSSNPVHWRPWSQAPSRLIKGICGCETGLSACQKGAGKPCIAAIEPERVIAAVDDIVKTAKK